MSPAGVVYAGTDAGRPLSVHQLTARRSAISYADLRSAAVAVQGLARVCVRLSFTKQPLVEPQRKIAGVIGIEISSQQQFRGDGVDVYLNGAPDSTLAVDGWIYATLPHTHITTKGTDALIEFTLERQEQPVLADPDFCWRATSFIGLLNIKDFVMQDEVPTTLQNKVTQAEQWQGVRQRDGKLVAFEGLTGQGKVIAKTCVPIAHSDQYVSEPLRK